MATLLVTDPIFLEHQVPAGHPERPDRLRAIGKALAADAFAPLVRAAAPEAGEATLALAHDPGYVAAIRDAVPAEGLVAVDPDTWLSPGSYRAAAHAAGGACLAVDEVAAGRARNAFCAMRPPGHHAEPAQAMGFASRHAVIAARHAQRPRSRFTVDLDASISICPGDRLGRPSILRLTHQMPSIGHRLALGDRRRQHRHVPSRAMAAPSSTTLAQAVLPAVGGFRPDLMSSRRLRRPAIRSPR